MSSAGLIMFFDLVSENFKRQPNGTLITRSAKFTNINTDQFACHFPSLTNSPSETGRSFDSISAQLLKSNDSTKEKWRTHPVHSPFPMANYQLTQR